MPFVTKKKMIPQFMGKAIEQNELVYEPDKEKPEAPKGRFVQPGLDPEEKLRMQHDAAGESARENLAAIKRMLEQHEPGKPIYPEKLARFGEGVREGILSPEDFAKKGIDIKRLGKEENPYMENSPSFKQLRDWQTKQRTEETSPMEQPEVTPSEGEVMSDEEIAAETKKMNKFRRR